MSSNQQQQNEEEELDLDLPIVDEGDYKGKIPFEDFTGKNVNQGDFDLDEKAFKLFASDGDGANYAFVRHLFHTLTRRPTYAIPTAGVRMNPVTLQYELFYNPKFLANINFQTVKGIVIHEIYHIILEHCDGRGPDDPEWAKVYNIAMDLAINSMIERNLLPDKILNQETGEIEPFQICMPGEGQYAQLPTHKASEWYLKKIMDEAQKGKMKPSELGGQFDDHDGFGEGDEEGGNMESARAVAKQKLKAAIEKATEQAIKTNSWGNMTQDLKQELIAKLQTRVDWKALLRFFIGRAQRSDRYSTHRKVNKRFPYILPGKRFHRHANIAISIDQSGSVDDNMLILFFSELNKLSQIATFTVVPFDTEVDPKLVYEWKKGQRHKVERVKCGGTDFNAPTVYVNEQSKFDGHIICTDMCAPKPIASKVPRIWMTTEECKKSMPFQTNEMVLEISRRELDKLQKKNGI